MLRLGHRRITLSVRPGSSLSKRSKVVHEWHKALLHEMIPPLIDQWQRRLGVEVRGYFLQRMKTKWGSCNHRARTIRLNTELVKKPKDLLEYVVVHELCHLRVRNHSPRFWDLVGSLDPDWQTQRDWLNARGHALKAELARLIAP